MLVSTDNSRFIVLFETSTGWTIRETKLMFQAQLMLDSILRLVKFAISIQYRN